MCSIAELREQHPQMGLHGIDGEEQLLRDLVVGGRAGERASVLVGTTQRDQHAALGGRELHGGRDVARHLGPRLLVDPRGAEGHRGGAEAQGVAVDQAAPAVQALAVDERAVAGQPVVDERPVLLDPLEAGVEARDLLVPVEHDVRRLAAPDRDLRHPGREEEQLLSVVAASVEQEGLALAFSLDPSLELGDGPGAGRGFAAMAPHYRRGPDPRRGLRRVS